MAAELTAPPPAPPGIEPPDRAWGEAGKHLSAWPTPPQRDLLRAALLEDARGVAAWQRIRETVEPATLDGSPAALLPHVARNLSAQGVDDPLLDLFRGVHRHTWARNQMLLARCLPLVGALQDAGIDAVLMKGAALMQAAGQQRPLRQMGDVDVLIPSAAREAALRVLFEHGLRPVDETLPEWFLLAYGDRFRHSANFADGAGTDLDLHWSPVLTSLQPALAGDLIAAAQPVELRGVRTRILCPVDELLVSLIHGLRWEESPSYRWVLDATLIWRGVDGQLDFDRLLTLARRHRFEALVAAGLELLDELEVVAVPAALRRRLRTRSPLRRLERSALLRAPRERGVLERAAMLQLAEARRRVSPDRRLTPLTHLRVTQARLGVWRPSHLSSLRHGGRPGPGRPVALNGAALGTGEVAPPQLDWGTRLELTDRIIAAQHCRYGLWLPDDTGCWIAGREARLALAVPPGATGPLRLELGVGGLPGVQQRLRVELNGQTLAELSFPPTGPRLHVVELDFPGDPESTAGRLDLRLHAPDAVSPQALGIGIDHRLLGGFLTHLTVSPAR